MNNIQSHIQMPRFMLRKFENSNHELYYLDMVSKEHISKGHAKSLNTKNDYYCAHIESRLDKEIESPFSNTLSKIDFSTEVKITSDVEETVKRFCSALLFREPSMIELVDSKSIAIQFIDIDDSTKRNLYTDIGISNSKKTDLFDKYFLNVIFNETYTPFVLPICGIYACYNKENHYLILPIDPYHAFALILKDYITKYINNDTLYGLIIQNDKVVKTLNETAAFSQGKKGWGYVVCPEKKELERIKSIIWNEVE